MSAYTQEQQIEIIGKARDLTATIMAEEDELRRLKSERFREMPKAPVRQVLPPPNKIQPQYPPVPKANYSFSEHLKIYFNENVVRSIVLLLFLFLIFFVLAFLSYSEKLKEMNKDPEYLKAREEAERVAAVQQKEAEDKVRAEQEKIDSEYEENKHHYDTVIIPEYNNELSKWENLQERKIQFIENELDLNNKALKQLYEETKLVSATYRDIWILEWLYEDMSTSDHDIRYATELLDRDRQRVVTEEAGRITQKAINNMNQNMRAGFAAVYSAIEEGNELQGETINILSKTRRDINIGNIVGTTQRHNTNKFLDEIINKKSKR